MHWKPCHIHSIWAAVIARIVNRTQYTILSVVLVTCRLQLTNVRKFPTQAILNEIQAEINRTSAHVKCYSLTPVTKSETELVKQGQDEKQKEYRCIIKVQNKALLDVVVYDDLSRNIFTNVFLGFEF